MDNNVNNKKRLWPVILKVLGVLIVFEFALELIIAFTGGTVLDMLSKGKYTQGFVAEGIAIAVVLILVLLSKEISIFKRKRLKFKEAIKLGMPMLVIAIVLFLSNVSELTLSEINWYNLISLIIYTAAIGFYEEVLYRGFVVNKLIKNNSDSKKKILFAIIGSSLIFSSAHLTNLLVGQDVLTTIAQVIQTFGLGVLLGSVYLVSDNIWSVIFLHGFYDFAAMLSDVNLIKDCGYVNNLPFSITIQSVVISLILTLIYILYSKMILKESTLKQLANEEVTEELIKEDEGKDKKHTKMIWILVGILFAFNILYGIFVDGDEDKYYKCYQYEEKEITILEKHYYDYNNYNFSLIHDAIAYNFDIYIEDDKVVLSKGTESITLDIKNPYRIAVVDNNILIITNDINNYKLYYSNYLTREDASFDGILNNIESSFREFDIPESSNLGFIIASNGLKYLMIESDIKDHFIISENKLYLVK